MAGSTISKIPPKRNFFEEGSCGLCNVIYGYFFRPAPSGCGDILINLLKCLIAHYAVFYIVAAICYGAFRLENFDGRMPFNFITFIELPECCKSYTHDQLANLTCLLVSYFINTWTFTALVRKTVWDYCLTLTLFHILLSCLVMLSFPLNWSWWFCIGVALLVQVMMAESVVFCFTDTKISRSNKVQPAKPS